MEYYNKSLTSLIPPPYIINSLESAVKKILDRCNLFYRTFGRIKTNSSIEEKFSTHKYSDNKKMQDLFGIRIVLYFWDDVELCKRLIQQTFNIDNISEDKNDNETFGPTRLNIVCKIPDDILKDIDEDIFKLFYIDKTFEIQIRTVLSEGWHEVEHDLRYKFKKDWEDDVSLDYSRTLNGIYATLETCDRALLGLLNQFSYSKYKNKSWDAMIRNHFRIRLSKETISQNLNDIFNSDLSLAKKFFNVSRLDFLSEIVSSELGKYLNGNINNLIYFINTIYIKSPDILKITPNIIIKVCDKT